MKLSPARTAAYDILWTIEAKRGYSSQLLAKHEPNLNSADRGLCHEIVLGVLRRRLLLDRYIDIFARNKNLDREIRIILQIGLFQLYYLDRVPDHAVVNEAVELALRAKKSSARGLVNAVLRSAIRQKPSLEFNSEVERISIETSHPEWLIKRWQDRLKFGSAENLARSNNKTPPVALRKTVKGDGIELTDKFVESKFVSGCFVGNSFSTELATLADDGKIYFQDEASQMVAASVDIRPDEKFLDVCASPGGKTTFIARELTGSSRAFLVAGDITHGRVEFLRETCIKQGAEMVNIVRYDAATDLPFVERWFDWVLVDAPCTGTGTIRHNPEIRYFVEPDDFVRMQKTQMAILSNAANLVKPKGKLVYSTCSLEKEENEDVCNAFLSASACWKKVTPKVHQQFITSEGFARTYPHRDGLDGFFIATFQRS